MYVAALFTHSWLRWIVLVLGLALLLAAIGGLRQGLSWQSSHERLHRIFLAALDIQFLLGIALYVFLSPISKAALANMGAAMKDPTLRFFGVEHVFTMVIAVAVAHVGRVRSKRKEGKARYRTTMITQIVFIVLVLIAIPWPGLDIARPLFRM